jgi:hypothetical protein
MAPGCAQRIIVREMIVSETFRRHILVLRSRGQRTAAEGLGRRRCRVAMPSQDKYASGIVLPRGSEKCQNRSRFAPSIRRSLADRASQSRLIHTREGTA